LWQFSGAAPSAGERKQAPSLSLTASDGTGLTLASLDARGIVQGPLAFTEIRLAFDNPDSRTVEGTFRITLPQGAAISRFAMRQGDRWQEGEVVEKQAARRAYEDFLHRRQDPALLEQAAGNEFSARVFPIPAEGRKELIVSYSQELGSAAPYRLMLRGLPKIGKLDAVVTGMGAAESVLDEIHVEDATPDRDLVVEPARLEPGEGLRSDELVLLRLSPAAQAGPDPVRSVVMMVDTSASRALGFERQLMLVEGLVAKLEGRTSVVVAAFDQGIDLIYEGAASGYAAQGTTKLRQRQAFGASDLGEAIAWAGSKAKQTGARRVILVTDGVPTKGVTEAPRLHQAAKALGPAGVKRLDAVAVGGIRDEALLRGLATAGLARNGLVIDGERGPEAAVHRLSSATLSVPVKVQGASWQWPLQLEGLQPGDEALVYALVPKGEVPRVKLGNRGFSQVNLATVDRALLERAWAKAKIAQLTASPPADHSPAEVKGEIVRLSKTHRVLSQHTALLVLETEADYERHKIDRKALADILTIEGSEIVRRQRSEDLLYIGKADVRPKGGVDSDGVVLRAPPAPAARPDGHATGEADEAPASEATSAPASPERKLRASTAASGSADDPGLGSIGTIGHGAGTGSGQGFGSGHGRLGRSHRSRPPRVRMGAVTVSGRLPPEVIQRIVRQNFGRFRLCYENGLRENPNLQGRVTVRFVIGRDGSISNVGGGGDMPNDGAISCVSRAFYGLSFPQPEGGVVTVSYPIVFTPGDVSGPRPSEPRPTGPPPRPDRPNREPVTPYEGKMAEVMQALAKGDRDGALQKAIAFRQAKPGDVMALVALGEAFEARGEVRSAARSYGSIIDLFSSRADLRRMAGQRLERLGVPYALSLAADSFGKAAAQRPDHPASHRLLAFALLRSGAPKFAFDAIEAGAKRSYPQGRFRAVKRILSEDMALIGAAWIKADPSKRAEVERRLEAVGAVLDDNPSLRFVLVWETDANDVDFHIRDAKGGHAYYSQKR
ncbi:MAG: AgmX/PglI C-terminal domain-containing protein, partial [Deltaproteobacteria bacterium]|nr:AgmX/PglI C-terminal domain-containing protein [Deltaproteobacteria bacterium]